MSVRSCRILIPALLYVLSVGTCLADELRTEFYQSLQEQGYYELAIRYLDQLEAWKNPPESLATKLDLERARMKIRLSELSDRETEIRLLGEARVLLNGFIKESLSAAESLDGRSELASLDMKQGQQLIARARKVRANKTRAASLNASARQSLLAAQKGLVQAVDAYKAEFNSLRLESATKSKKRQAKKEQQRIQLVEGSLMLTRLNAATTFYHLAQTLDPALEDQKPDRDKYLEQAIAGFEELFQEYRGSFASLVALLWQARSFQERGSENDLQEAMYRYEELVVNEPERAQDAPLDQLIFFAQAQSYRTDVLIGMGKEDQAIVDTEDWLETRSRMRRSPATMIVQLASARAIIAKYEKLPEKSPERQEGFLKALKYLDEVGRIPSQAQIDALELKQKYGQEVAVADAKATTFEEAVFYGEAAMNGQDWASAVAKFEQALAMAKADTDPLSIDMTYYRLSYCLYQTKELAQSLKVAQQLYEDRAESKLAPEAAALGLAVYSALSRSVKTVEERDQHLNGLIKLSELTESRWPDHSKANSARRTRAGVLLYRLDFDGAGQAYSDVRPDSELYADSQLRAGKAYWTGYRTEQLKSDEERDDATMKRWAKASLGAFDRAIAAYLEGASEKGSWSAALVEARLVKTETMLKLGEAEAASVLAEALAIQVTAANTSVDEPTRLRVLVAVMEARISQGRVETAVDLIDDIDNAEQADGQSRVTSLFVQLGHSLEQRIDTLETAGKHAQAQEVRGSFQQFLGKLASRTNQSFSSLQYLGESYYALGDYGQSLKIFDMLLKQLNGKTDAKSVSETSRVRVRRVTALRSLGQYQKAFNEVEALLKQNVRLLPAILERCQILQEWGTAQKNTERLEQAVRSWYSISRKLAARKPVSEDYFRTRYGIASCYAAMGRPKDAAKWLKATQVKYPNLGSPETKARFEALLKEVQ